MTKEEMQRRKKVITELMQDPIYRPMRLREIAAFLNVEKEKREELLDVLEELITEGKVERLARGRYAKPRSELIEGIYTANPRGFGFVAIEGREDVFIPEGKEGSALHGDRVSLRIERGSKKRREEGHIVNVLEHANEFIIGLYKKSRHFGFVLPDNRRISKDIFIPEGKSMNAKNETKVKVKLHSFGDKDKGKPEGEIVEILGYRKDPGVDILSIIRAFELPTEFPAEVREQAKSVSQSVDISEYPKRKDLREEFTITIDGEDAKDLDDAISISYEKGVWRLGVHIADVAEYVREGSPLDKEALKRGTSVYLVDRVLPMLPPELSNGICSLNKGEDRLALSCIMDIDEKGKMISHSICETIIHVNHRMTYNEVYDILKDGESAAAKKYSDTAETLKSMENLALKLRKQRFERGSIDFDLPESRVELDAEGKVIEIKAYEMTIANKIIEEFMLIANETVAEEYYWQELPFVYRVHDKPDPEKIQALSIFIHNFGYSIRLKNGEIRPKEIQKLLTKIEGGEAEMLINRITLRSMKQARYQTEAVEHFGLAAKYYTHFTSPIRRYPDLQIHRIIKENLKGGITDKRRAHYEKILDEVSFHASMKERQAADAERETVAYKKSEYMQAHIGEHFSGVISSVTAYGLYVELENTVEGMIRIGELKDDYYQYVEESYALVGERTGRSYRLGQKIEIIVSGADRLSGNIDFLPLSKKYRE